MTPLTKNRQTIRLFTPIFGLIAIMTATRLAGNIWGLAKYGIEPRDLFVLSLFPISLILGNFYCGWFCPAGLFQRGLFRLGRVLFGEKRQKKWALSAQTEGKLRYVRNGLLATWLTTLLLTPFGFVSVETTYFIKVSAGLGLLMISLPLALFTERFFCRNFCINGALYGLSNKIGRYRIERNDPCVSCGKCNSVCPMGIQVSTLDRVEKNHCISCLKCIDGCPINKKADAIAISLKKASTEKIH